MLISLFCPGLGAAYNGQTSKALIHFVAFIGLFQLAIVTSGSPFFVLGFIGMWLYAALDAWRTAQVIRVGVSPGDAEDVLVKRFSGNPKLWGVVLTVIGFSFVLQTLFDLNQLLSRFILPALLIGIGVYLIRGFFDGSGMGSARNAGLSDTKASSNYTDNRSFDTSFFESSADTETQFRQESWKNRR
jgi:hypothetical protein